MNKQYRNGLASALGAGERSGGERSEPERSSTAPNAGDPPPPSPQDRPRAQRRHFTAAYKQKSLAAADAATASGAIGALLGSGANWELRRFRPRSLC